VVLRAIEYLLTPCVTGNLKLIPFAIYNKIDSPYQILILYHINITIVFGFCYTVNINLTETKHKPNTNSGGGIAKFPLSNGMEKYRK